MSRDAQVLEEAELKPLLDQFVCVRVINANALDFARFQFDFGLSFSTMFFNGDGTVYGRYGSWMHQKDGYNKTTTGFRRTLESVAEVHRAYPRNKVPLASQLRAALTRYAAEAGAAPLVKLSHPVVEAGIYDAPAGTALILANFTYEPIKTLTVELPTRAPIKDIQSLEHGKLRFESQPAPAPWRDEGFTHVQRFTLPLGVNDVVLVR